MENKSKRQAKNTAKEYENNTFEQNQIPLSEKKKLDSMSMDEINKRIIQEIIDFAWSIKEDLRGPIPKTEWGKTILPFILLRRLGRVLESTKNNVLVEYEKIKNEEPKYVEARLNKKTGFQFNNKSKFNLEKILGEDEKNIEKNMKSYINAFSPNVQDIFEKFEFLKQVGKLADKGILFGIVEKFASSNLDFDPKKIDNHMMGTIYEEIIRRTSEETNENAGEYFTPREVIHLMVNLLFIHEKESLTKKGIVRSIYDPAVGTGGMLSIASEYIENINKDAIIDAYGQEYQDPIYAICKSDMLIKNLDLDRIKLGNSLIQGNSIKAGDGFYDDKFHYMLSNPPYGEDWGSYEKGIELEAGKGSDGKYGAGIPRKSDGSFLFLMHMISKMKSREEGGSRIAIVLNGSPLFTGEAGSGESNIRKWIIENDMLETIIGLPNDMFYNTGLSTYIWIVTNNKEEKRKGKIQLINATSDKFYKKMKSNLGKKRNFIDDIQIDSITKIYESFSNDGFSKIFDNEDFGYTRITVDRPLRRNFQVSKERLDKLKQEKIFKKLDTVKEKPKVPRTKDVLAILTRMPSKLYTSYDDFSDELKKSFSKTDFKLSTSLKNFLENVLSEKDENAEPQKGKNGNFVPDLELRDHENIPLKKDIDKYLEKEVYPFVENPLIDDSTRDKIGYEIPFLQHFYVYQPLRSLKKIDEEINQLQSEILEELEKLME
jgi:type I restriction enzyme M protein